MKNKLIKLFLALFLTLGLSGCSNSIGVIRQAFEREGYSWQRISGVDNETRQSGVKAVYSATKGFTGLAIIIELQGTEEVAEAVQAIKKDPNFDGEMLLHALLTSYSEVPVTKGNCFIITLTKQAIEIFQNA